MKGKKKGSILTNSEKPRPNHDIRRRNRGIASKMIRHSKAYILMMWDGRDAVPTTIIDISALAGRDTTIARAFGKAAQYCAAVTKVCSESEEMTAGQQQQAEHAAAFKQKRSEILAAASNNERTDNET
jgi:hypothetical protein